MTTLDSVQNGPSVLDDPMSVSIKFNNNHNSVLVCVCAHVSRDALDGEEQYTEGIPYMFLLTILWKLVLLRRML